VKQITKIASALKRHKRFLITSHVNLEGDSVGSQLAMADMLKRMGKRYVLINTDPVPKILKFMLQGEKFKRRLKAHDKFDAVMSVDCPVPRRTGRVASYFPKAKEIINIDHHVSNSYFGNVNWVDPLASSCGEMLYYLYKELGIKITKRSALFLYVAIATDTGFFTYENTTYKTHQIISELLKTGIKSLWISRKLNESKSFGNLKLLEESLGTLQLFSGGKIATMHASMKMLKKYGLDSDSTENFVNFARSVDSAKVAIFFLEKIESPGEVHVSFRSKGEVDVNKLATLFGGGGHPNASGCLIKGTVASAKGRILPRAKKFI